MINFQHNRNEGPTGKRVFTKSKNLNPEYLIEYFSLGPVGSGSYGSVFVLAIEVCLMR